MSANASEETRAEDAAASSEAPAPEGPAALDASLGQPEPPPPAPKSLPPVTEPLNGVFAVCWRPGVGLETLESLPAIRAALDEPEVRVWVDLTGRTASSDVLLERLFEFHPLAVEDVYKEGHRPKTEDYDEYVYVILQALKRTNGWQLEAVELAELDVFLGTDFLVTHHTEELPSITSVQAAVMRKPALLERGPAFVAHAILDTLVDRFLPLVEAYDVELERLEVQVLAGSGQVTFERIHELTCALQQLRRVGLRQTEVLARLARGAYEQVPEEAKPFYRDVHEHFAHFMDEIGGSREELISLFNTFHSVAAHRMNEVMKVLTVIATIMLPLTFVAGVYGMNFEHMPELKWRYGYPLVVAAMLLTAAGMLAYFRRRGWI